MQKLPEGMMSSDLFQKPEDQPHRPDHSQQDEPKMALPPIDDDLPPFEDPADRKPAQETPSSSQEQEEMDMQWDDSSANPSL